MRSEEMVPKHREREFKLQLRAYAEALKILPKGDPRKATISDTYLDLYNALKRHDVDVRDYFPTYHAFRQFGYDNADELQDVLQENADSYREWPISKFLSGYNGGGDKGVGATSDPDADTFDEWAAPFDPTPDLSDLDTTDAERRERSTNRRERVDFYVRTLFALAAELEFCQTSDDRQNLIDRYVTTLMIGTD